MAILKNSYIVLCTTGLLLSCYAVYIEHAKMKDKDYVALCDIDEQISCTSVLSSEYSIGLGIVGKILGEENFLNVPSAYYGVLFYCILIMLSFSRSKTTLYIILLLNIVSFIASVYLMYILLFVMEKTCLVCYGIHVANTGLLVLGLLRVNWSNSNTKKKIS